MERYMYVNRLVNRLTDNEVLKTYYTLILMAETNDAKALINNQFWQKFEFSDAEEKIEIRAAFQLAERNLLSETKLLKQELNDYKVTIGKLKEAA